MTDNLTADVHDDVANSKSVPHLTMLEYVTKWNKQLELDFKNEDVCIISKINEGTAKSLKKLDLARDESKSNSPFPTTLKEGGNTKSSYMKMLRKLYRHFVISGHWDSLLILDPWAIKNVVPMHPDHISECLRYEYTQIGLPLLDENDTPLLNVFNKPIIKVTSGWSAPSNLFQFKSAINSLHKNHHYCNAFEYGCDECLIDYHKYLSILKLHPHSTPDHLIYGKGCNRHLYQSRKFIRGNPVLSIKFEQECKHFKIVSDKHVVTSCTSLLPTEIRQLYEHLKPVYAPFSVMIYTMVVLATSLGLRFDELGDVNIQDFRPDLSLTRTNYIQFLTLGIQGKTDQQKVYYKVYFQDQVPQLCPCRLLLVWMSFMNFKDGSYLFPTKIALNKFLINRSTRSQAFFSSPIKYYSLRREIEDFFVDGLGILLRVFGTHIFRKTFYLFGQLGGATYEKLKFAARHKHDSSAMLYLRDAATMMETMENLTFWELQKHEVNPFRDIRILDENIHKLLIQESQNLHTSVQSMPSFFVEVLLGVKHDSTDANNLGVLMEKAIAYKRPEHVSKLKDQNLLKRKFDDFLVESEIPEHDRISTALVRIVETHNQTVGVESNIQITGESISSKLDNLEERFTIKKLVTSTEKVHTIIRIGDAVDYSDSKFLTQAARDWYNKTYKKTKVCLECHCNNSVDVFLSKHPNVSQSRLSHECNKQCGVKT